MRPRKKIKMEDIASQMGVSVVTVSNALSGRKGVSRELREKIVRKADEMGYRSEETVKKSAEPEGKIAILTREEDFAGKSGELTDFSGAALTAEKGRMSGEQPASAELIREARRINYAAVPFEMRGGELPFNPEKMDGMIFLGRMKPETMENYLRCGLPAVGCGFYDLHVQMDYVVDAAYHNMMDLVRYLAGLGHRKITFATVRPGAASSMDKMLGFWASLVRMGLTDFDDQCAIENISKYTAERAAGCAARGEATAIVCTDAGTQREVMRLLGERGMRIPGDISVAACGGLSGIKEEAEAFTACLPDLHGIAERTVHFISRQIRKGAGPSGIHAVAGVMHVGQTTGLCWNQKTR